MDMHVLLSLPKQENLFHVLVLDNRRVVLYCTLAAHLTGCIIVQNVH